MDLKLASGKVIKGIPDGMRPDEIVRVAVGKGMATHADFGLPGPTGNFAENTLAGFGRGLTRAGLGVKQILGVGDQDALKSRIQEDNALGAPLARTAGGFAGETAGSVLPAVGLAMVPGMNTVAGAGAIGALTGAVQPVEQDSQRAGNIALGAAGGAAGQYLGGKLASVAQNRLARRTAEQAALRSQNAVRDATLGAGQKAGYSVLPMEGNPSIVNKVVEGVSGKIQTGQAVAIKNQQVTNRLARQALGLSDDAPLTRATVDMVRGRLGKVYGALKEAGDFVPDSQFADDIARIASDADKVAKQFPSLAKPEVSGIIDDFASKDVLPGSETVDAIGLLYQEASANLREGTRNNAAKQLGLAQRKIADALQDLIERNLKAGDADDMLTAYKAARQQYAKAMTVRRALKEGTGNVMAGKVAQQLNSGAPLSGELRTIGEFANQYPAAVATPRYQPGISAADAMIGSLASTSGFAGAGPMGLLAGPAMVAGRLGARSLATSPAYQRAMVNPDYSLGMLTRLGPQLLSGPIASRVAPIAGQQLALRYGE